MSATMLQPSVQSKTQLAATSSGGVRAVSSPRARGPSRRRRRAQRRLGNAVAFCAMGAWVVLALMPIIAALYAAYGS